MRVLLLALVAALTLLYFTVGIRLGYVTLTPTYMFNATGVSSYPYRTLEDPQQVGLVGSCKVSSGSATLYLYGPDNAQIGNGQVCQKGERNEWSLNLVGGGRTGLYRFEVHLDKFTGQLTLNEYRSGGQ